METHPNHPAGNCSPREFTDIRRCFSYSPATGGVFCYAGPSMCPTLTPQDMLYVKPYGSARMRPGDVVVFQPDGVAGFVVHRIVSVTGGSEIKTRGDNNDCIDERDLKADQILGRVVHAKSRGRVRRIHGGLPGKIAAAYVSLGKCIRRSVFRALRKPYRKLIHTGTFHWVGDRLETRIVAFQRNGLETELHLFMGGRFAGSLPWGGRKWDIKPPFHLIINENILPSLETLQIPVNRISQ